MPPQTQKPPSFTTYKTFILAGERFSVGDTVAVKAGSGKGRADYIASIERIHTDKEGEVLVDGRWYYRPEETAMGRQPWHGQDEVIDSDHIDTFHVRCVNSKCNIYSLSEYEKKLSEQMDKAESRLPIFYCRSRYLKKRGKIEEPLPLYCACKQPQNPEYTLLSCDTCDDWFFGKCVGVSPEKAMKLKRWICPLCTATDGRKRKTSDSSFLDAVRNGTCCPWEKSQVSSSRTSKKSKH